MLTGERKQQPGCCAVLFKPDLVNCRYQRHRILLHHLFPILENKLRGFFFTGRSLGGVLDPQKSPKAEPWAMGSFWVMPQDPPSSCCAVGPRSWGCVQLIVKKCLVQIFPMQTQHLPQSCWGSAGAEQVPRAVPEVTVKHSHV